jgi:hydroxymethylbilane synthase
LGTSSPRRIAQFRRLGDIEFVAIRGNVATRIAKLERDNLDGVVLAAAGLKRLGIDPEHRIDLPTDRFVPAPAQGALAIQAREGDPAADLIKALDHRPDRITVEAERSFLHAIDAGCHTPVGALAALDGATVSLRGQLFSDDGTRMVEGGESGEDPRDAGRRLAERLLRELGART